MPKIKDTKALIAGQAVTTTIKHVGRDVKEGTVYAARGTGFFARQVANVVADFGRGLKRGWEKS